jgi:lipopolysaccharide export system protein LptA
MALLGAPIVRSADANLFEKITANSSRGNKQTAQIEYSGSVEIQLTNLKVSADQATVSKTQFSASGSPIQFSYQALDNAGETINIEVTSNNINYSLQDGLMEFINSVAVTVIKPNSRFQFNAEKLTYRHDHTKQNQPLFFQAIGEPIAITSSLGSEQARFQADQLSLDFRSNQLTLSNNVVFENSVNRITGSKLNYDLSTGRWEFPTVKNQRIEMTKNNQND